MSGNIYIYLYEYRADLEKNLTIIYFSKASRKISKNYFKLMIADIIYIFLLLDLKY